MKNVLYSSEKKERQDVLTNNYPASVAHSVARWSIVLGGCGFDSRPVITLGLSDDKPRAIDE